MKTEKDPIIDTRLPAAVAAFDGVAEVFDERFGAWLSVAAQRAAVRRRLLRVFPRGCHVLELGGGTGEDAIFMARHGRRVLMTDGSPTMVARARQKVIDAGLSDLVSAHTLTLEQLDRVRDLHQGSLGGVFSNFASLNCIPSLAIVAGPLARLLSPGAPASLVLFGKRCVGEMVLHSLRGEWRVAFRRLTSDAVRAKIGGRAFEVWYPTVSQVRRAMAPWFALRRIRGIGIFVPPSAAEPGISGHPHLVRMLSGVDRLVSAPLARLADHMLYEFVRTDEPTKG